MRVSIIIRTYNESKYLDQLLTAIGEQEGLDKLPESVIVDSGSTDETIAIAKKHNTVIKEIKKSEFSFGRSLNIGCEIASGEILAIISGHCVPVGRDWLYNLVSPIIQSEVSYVYGRQIGDETSRYSEIQHFNKTFGSESKIPQEGFFCNNANSALDARVWSEYKFDEELSGLEDMDLAKRILNAGYKVAYSGDATVYHLHSEKWKQIKRRYEREALALRIIMPEVQLNFLGALRFFFKSVSSDLIQSFNDRKFIQAFSEIIMYRSMQYWGAYKGNHIHRELSREMLERYYYPE